MDASLKIVIVDENPIRAAILQDGLREAGYTNVAHITERTGRLARIYALDPDVILIDLENPNRDELEQMFQVSRTVSGRSQCSSIRATPPRSTPACRPTSSATRRRSASSRASGCASG